ncbi:hypothetical protein [Streptomyces sp. YIM S03343]
MVAEAEQEAEETGRRGRREAPGGVVLAFGRQLKLLRIRAGLDRAEFAVAQLAFGAGAWDGFVRMASGR